MIDEDPNAWTRLDVSAVPVYVSVGVVGPNCWVFDLGKAEEDLCRTKLVFGVGLAQAPKASADGSDGSGGSGGRKRKKKGGSDGGHGGGAPVIRRVFSAKSASLEYGALLDDVMEAACLAGKRLIAALDASHQKGADDRAFHIAL